MSENTKSSASHVKEETIYKGKEAVMRKLAFASGEMVYNMPWMLVSSFLAFFLTDVAIVPAAVVSILFLGVRVFDAVNDPLIGGMADRTRTKLGRYRPWMLVGAIILLPVVILLFWAHPDWNEGSRIAYACILYVIAVVGATMWNIPFTGLNAAVTPYPLERASFSSYRILVSSVACAISSGLFLPLVGKFGGESGDNVHGYLMAAVIICCIAIPFAFTSIGGTKEVVKPPVEQKMKLSVLMRNIFANPPLLIVAAGFFIYGFMSYGRMTVAMYYFTYNWGNSNLFTLYSLVNGLVCGGAAFFGVHLIRIFGSKRNTVLFGYGGLFVFSLILFFLSPENSNSTVVLILLYISGIFQGFVTSIIYGMLPDTVEYGLWKTGLRADGFCGAATSFMLKVGGAISPTLLLALLSASGYVPNSTQNASSLYTMNAIMNLMPAIFCAVAFLLFIFYKLDGKTHAKIVEELKERGHFIVDDK